MKCLKDFLSLSDLLLLFMVGSDGLSSLLSSVFLTSVLGVFLVDSGKFKV